jgi:hypothetical protein
MQQRIMQPRSPPPPLPQVLALAKKMLRRRDATDILEAAYNRYAFHDGDLPRWFQEDEARHMRCAAAACLCCAAVWWAGGDAGSAVHLVPCCCRCYNIHPNTQQCTTRHTTTTTIIAIAPPPPLTITHRPCRPIAPVTKAEVEAEKERLKAIDARPIKKVAEAKARKKRRMVAQLASVRDWVGLCPGLLRGCCRACCCDIQLGAWLPPAALWLLVELITPVPAHMAPITRCCLHQPPAPPHLCSTSSSA